MKPYSLFIIVLMANLVFTKTAYPQDRPSYSKETFARFLNDHKTVVWDSVCQNKLLGYVSKDYDSNLEEVGSFLFEKSTKFNYEVFLGIKSKPCSRIHLKDSIYLYFTSRISSAYENPKYVDTSFIAKIYDNQTGKTIHNFDIIKLNKARVFTSIALKGDTVKYYVVTSYKGKIRETQEKECSNPPDDCLISFCHNYVLANGVLRCVNIIVRKGVGIMNDKEFYFKKIDNLYVSNCADY